MTPRHPIPWTKHPLHSGEFEIDDADGYLVAIVSDEDEADALIHESEAWAKIGAERAARQRLPNRRASDRFELPHDGIAYTVTVGRYEDGRVAEIFMTTNKGEAAVETMARDLAVATSLALQHGCPVETLAAATTRLSTGAPAGPLGALLARLRDETYPQEQSPC